MLAKLTKRNKERRVPSYITLCYYFFTAFTGFAVSVSVPFFESSFVKLSLLVSFFDESLLDSLEESLESLESLEEADADDDEDDDEADDDSFNNLIRESRSATLTLLLFIFSIISSICFLSSLDVADLSLKSFK